MHTHQNEGSRHRHAFLGADHARNERRTSIVVAITAAMMVVEIVAGVAFGSMALLADGVHMATHAGALGVAAAAYVFARKRVDDPRFTFGTGKVGELAAFASAIILGAVTVAIGAESVGRLVDPVPVHFAEAIPIAVIGLLVNLACAALLQGGGGGHAHPGHEHRDHAGHGDLAGHHRHAPATHHDHNLRAAYVHVLADALTSVLAIAALVAGSVFGILWLDPVIGVLGAVLVAVWAVGLVRSSSAVLLDVVPSEELEAALRARIETDGDRIVDLHLWRVGPGHLAAIIALVSDRPRAPDHYKGKLAGLPQLSHVTVEVHRCEERALAA